MLSKTQFTYYLQCPKYLWLYKNKKELYKGEEDLDYKQLQGESVEFWVYSQYKDGVDCEAEGGGDIFKSIDKTKELISSGKKALIQPSFHDGDLFCRNDLLVFDKKINKWDIIEVKSTTHVDEDLHITDVAFQKICLENCGLKINKAYVYFVNNEYVRKGKVDPKKLIKKEDVTERVSLIESAVKIKIGEALEFTKKTKKEPAVKILKQCSDPYDCGFIDYCWKNIPKHSVYDLSLKANCLAEMVEEDKIKVEDVPEEMVTRENKKRYYIAETTDKVFIDKAGIAGELSSLVYPLYFLDYETYNPAVPLFDGFKPYQQMVFQYSLHVRETPGTKVEHYEFLADKWEDPCPELLKNMTSQIGDTGTILVWNEGFEKGRNEEMAKMYPKFKEKLLSVNSRVYDLATSFKKNYYVHKDFKGSWSIKSILPVLIPSLSHKDLNIQEGGTASESYRKLIDKKIGKKEKEVLGKDMLEYCKLDTLAMVEILDKVAKDIK